MSADLSAPDSGVAGATVSPSAVDFGKAPCGGAAAANQSLTITNGGTGALTYTATISGTAFKIVGSASGTVAAGGSGTVTIGASAVAATATAGTAITGTLSLATNDPAHATIGVPLSVTPAGGYLTLSPTMASFGVYPVGSSVPNIPVILTNTGNQPVTIAFVQPSAPQFSVDWTGSPGTVTVAPGAAVPGLMAQFQPMSITASSSSAGITTSDPICNTASAASPSATAIPMTGQGTSGVIQLSTTDVFFGKGGLVNCGATAPAQTFKVANTGNQAFAWLASLNKGSSSPFGFSPTSGTIPAGASVTVTVTPASGIPATASTKTDAFGDAIQLSTDIPGDSPHTITLHQTANGAVLAFAPASIDFGQVPVGTSPSAPFTIANSGDATANVTLASDNGKFTVSPVGPTAVAGGASGSETATYSPGSAATPAEMANVTMAVGATDVLCAPLPSALTMTGQGVNGSVSISPTSLDFGDVNCGATAAAQTITVTNTGTADFTITGTSLGKGASSPYTVTMSPTSGVATKGGGQVIITVTPAAVPATSAVTANLYGDTLTITTNVTGDSPHQIPLRETAQGAIFVTTLPSTDAIDFGSVAKGSVGSSVFTVTNDGNAPGTMTFSPTMTSIFPFMPSSLTVPAGSSSSETSQFAPVAAMSYSDTAAVGASTSTVLCQPLPLGKIALSGTGTNMNQVTLDKTSLTFGAGGLVGCGSTATTQSVMVTNGSSLTLNLTYTFAAGASSPYTASGPASVSAGATVIVTVAPKKIPATASTAPDAFADTLTINGMDSGGVIDESHTVQLHETAQGAILSFNPTSLSLGPVNGISGGSSTKSFTVNNAGNLSAPYTLAVGGTDASKFSVSPTSGTAGSGGGSVPENATFTVGGLTGSGKTFTGDIALSSSVTLCSPLPAPLSLTGTTN